MTTWVDDISQLDYYNSNGFACFCEEVTQANDLILQGSFAPQGADLSISILLYSPDGLEEYEPLNTYFNVYYGVNPDTGQWLFNAQLKEFSPQMCLRKCWIIRVLVFGAGDALVFDKYTQRYCKSDCCQAPGDIDISEANTIYNPTTQPPVPASSIPLVAGCQKQPLIRIVSVFDCYDKFSGTYYGIPPVILSGAASFPYVKVSTIKGRVVRRPKEITRETSYNCRLQRSESANQYLVEGFDLLPAWKMAEIENQLHANEIWIDQFPEIKQYQFAGGVAFKKPNGARECDEIFKMFVTLEDCIVRQVFGCPEPCPGTPGAAGFSAFFVIGDNYQDGSPLYSDGRQLIGTSIQDLLDWIRTQPSVTDVQLLAPSPAECSFTAIIGISGNNPPQSIYLNTPSPANRVFNVNIDSVEDICSFVPVITCKAPEIGTISFAPVDCDAPVFGTISIETVTPDAVGIYPYGNWVIDTGESAAYVSNGAVSISLKVTNDDYAPIPGEEVDFSGEVIAVLGPEARPGITISLTSVNSSLPPDWLIVITPAGLVQFTGVAISNDLVNVEVSFNNLVYNI